MKKIHIFIFFLCVFILPFSVSAYDLRVSPEVIIDKEYNSDSNLYLASFRTWFNAEEYKKDIVSVSLNQVIQATTTGDVLLLGKKIKLTGNSVGDNRIIADTVYVSGYTQKDLIIIARHVVFEPTSKLEGDTLVLAHTAELSGEFLGKTQITASKIFLSGSIAGSTTLTGTKIFLNNGTKIYNNLSYFSPQKAYINQGVEVKNQIYFNQIESIKQNDVIKRLFFIFVSFWALIKLIATLFVLFLLTHLFKLPLQKMIEGINKKIIKTAGIGLMSMIIIPIIGLVLFGSLILIPVSIIVFSLYITLLMILPSVSAILGAYFYQKHIKKQEKISIEFLPPALILLGLTIINFVPYIGGMVIYSLYIISFGAIMTYLFSLIRWRKIF